MTDQQRECLPAACGPSDHPSSAQLGERSSSISEPALENFLVMLAEGRCRTASLPRGHQKLGRSTWVREPTGDWMREINEKLACLEMLRLKQVAHGGDGGKGDPLFLRRFAQVQHALLLDPLLQQRLQNVPVRRSQLPGGEDWFERPTRLPHQLDELVPLMFFHRLDENPAILRLHRLERLDHLFAK